MVRRDPVEDVHAKVRKGSQNMVPDPVDDLQEFQNRFGLHDDQDDDQQETIWKYIDCREETPYAFQNVTLAVHSNCFVFFHYCNLNKVLHIISSSFLADCISYDLMSRVICN